MIPNKFSGLQLIIITVFGIVTIILLLLFTGFLVQELSGPEFTVQDAWVYCCDHPEVEITGYGDNCSWVIDYVYNGECYNDNKTK